MSKFMQRYKAYQYAWVVEFDVRCAFDLSWSCSAEPGHVDASGVRIEALPAETA